MKILLINNNTQHMTALSKSLAGHNVEVQIYRPGLKFNHHNKDLVILSGGGGEGNEINDVHQKRKLWYEDQMEFVLACDKPMIGICMGFEVICRAYSEQVEEMPNLIEQVWQLQTTKAGRSRWNHKILEQHEAHKWHVPNIRHKELEVLAASPSGIEIIRHSRRPIIATQFHPELGGSLKLSHFLKTGLA